MQWRGRATACMYHVFAGKLVLTRAPASFTRSVGADVWLGPKRISWARGMIYLCIYVSMYVCIQNCICICIWSPNLRLIGYSYIGKYDDRVRFFRFSIHSRTSASARAARPPLSTAHGELVSRFLAPSRDILWGWGRLSICLRQASCPSWGRVGLWGSGRALGVDRA